MKVDAISKAKAQLVTQSPFWAYVIMNTPLIVSKDVPTAGTDGKTIWVNPDFVDTLTTKQVVFLLAHEAAHIIFLHASRCGHRLKDKWNHAADYVINNLLTEDGFEFIPGGLLDAKYISTAERVYDLLPDNPPDPEGGIGDDLLPSNMTPAEAAEHAQQVKQVVAQAATVSRMAGKLSAGLSRLVGDILAPQVPWPDVLRNYMQEVAKDDESWSRRNRRFHDVYLPSRYSVRMGPMCVILDTSGSIGTEDLNKAIAEVRAVADQVQPESIRVICADSRVTNEQVLEREEEVVVEIKGGGGTDMRVPLEHVEQYEPCVVVLITDGETPWPSVEPPYPLIVCCTTAEVPPVGQLVRIR